MPVDYAPDAIMERLRAAARGVSLRPEDRLLAKIDYSPRAVLARLREVERARRACLRLAEGTLEPPEPTAS